MGRCRFPVELNSVSTFQGTVFKKITLYNSLKNNNLDNFLDLFFYFAEV